MFVLSFSSFWFLHETGWVGGNTAACSMDLSSDTTPLSRTLGTRPKGEALCGQTGTPCSPAEHIA